MCSLTRSLASSVLSFSHRFAPSLSQNNRRKKGRRERGGGREARFLSPRGFSPLLKHTLSSCLLLLSLSLSSLLASFLVHFPPENVPRSHLLVGRRSFSSSTLSPLTPSRRPDLFLVQLLSRTVANKCIECKLPTNFFHRFVLALRVHARACISLLGDICSQLFHNEVARIRETSRSPSDLAVITEECVLHFLVSHLPFPLFFVSNVNVPMTNVKTNDNEQ